MSNQMCRQNGSRSHSRKSMAPRRSSLQLWTPKMKNRDERRRVKELCLAKIKKIEDRDSCLLRSVLVTNILKKLQQESDHESRQVPSATPSSSLSGSRSERPSSTDLDFDTDILNFSEFYLPPTPRMISSLEEDEVLELALPPVVKETPPPPPLPEPVFERTLTDEETIEQLVPVVPRSSHSEVQSTECTKRPREESSEESESKRPRAPDTEVNFVSSVNTNGEFEVDRTYTCAQSSMFCDLHNAVFHGIMTSLES